MRGAESAMMSAGVTYDAEVRIKKCLLGLCIVCFLLGVALIVVGLWLCWHLEGRTDRTPPRIWTLSFLPFVHSSLGIICLAHNRKVTILLWVMTSLVSVPTCMVLCDVSRFFNTRLYAVHLQVYGACATDRHACKCEREQGNGVVTLVQSAFTCDHIWYSTTLYLVFIGILILLLVLVVIMNGLVVIMTLCLQYCSPSNTRYSLSTSIATIGNGVRGEYRSSYKNHQSVKSAAERRAEYLHVPSVDIDLSHTPDHSSRLS